MALRPRRRPRRRLPLAERGRGRAWFAIAAWVGVRFFRHRKSIPWETASVLRFVVFGVSDLWESRAVTLWLIAAKGLISSAIVIVR